MIDIHCHILPGLDDGPRTIEESAAMLRIAAKTGTTDLVATPHASPEFHFDPEQVAAKLAELSAVGLPLRLHSGCDFHLSYDNIQDALNNPLKYTINQKRYLLVEFSDLLIAKGIDGVFARMRAAGITPIITHPERNWLLQQRIERLACWAENGCLLQLTAHSLLGRFGGEAKKFARELLARNLAHFVASDAHDPVDRSPRLDEAYALVARQFGAARAELLFVTNPRAALNGEPIEMPPAEPPRRRKWLWFGSQ